MAEKTTLEKLKEDEREVRRNLIIEATRTLFDQRQFHEIGMRDIAAEAGVSVASLYRYFPSRDDLFVEALILELKQIEAWMQRHLEAEGRSSLEEFGMGFVDYLLDNEATFQMMAHFMIKREINPQTMDRFHVVQRFFLGMFDRMLSQAGVRQNVRKFSHACYAAFMGVVITFRNYPGRDKEEIRKHVHRLVMMIATIMTAGMTRLDETQFDWQPLLADFQV